MRPTYAVSHKFLVTEGDNVYCEITELDAHGAPAFERRVPLVLADNQQLIIVPKMLRLLLGGLSLKCFALDPTAVATHQVVGL
jgi:hypothetical protein